MQCNRLFKELLTKATGTHCKYCGKLTKLAKGTNQKHDTLTIEHVAPRLSDKQKHLLSNIIIACYECNRSKAILDDPQATNYKLSFEPNYTNTFFVFRLFGFEVRIYKLTKGE